MIYPMATIEEDVDEKNQSNEQGKYDLRSR